MIAMHYRIALPADYDMAIIRQRIVERGHVTDNFPQLAFKAYLYANQEAPTARGCGNRYAPFYLWHDTEGMNAFLCGAGFAGLVASFGRPAVHTWSTWHVRTARDLSVATHATYESTSISEHFALGTLRDAEHASVQADADRGALAVITAVDPHAWTLMRFRLWRDIHCIHPTLLQHADVYQVGHVSQPSAQH